jgi:hypothetical protein
MYLAVLFAAIVLSFGGRVPNPGWDCPVRVSQGKVTITANLGRGPAGAVIGAFVTPISAVINVPFVNITVEGRIVRVTARLPRSPAFRLPLLRIAGEALRGTVGARRTLTVPPAIVGLSLALAGRR